MKFTLWTIKREWFPTLYYLSITILTEVCPWKWLIMGEYRSGFLSLFMVWIDLILIKLFSTIRKIYLMFLSCCLVIYNVDYPTSSDIIVMVLPIFFLFIKPSCRFPAGKGKYDKSPSLHALVFCYSDAWHDPIQVFDSLGRVMSLLSVPDFLHHSCSHQIFSSLRPSALRIQTI